MDFSEFRSLIKTSSGGSSGLIIPVYKKILADLLTPVNAYLKIRNASDYSFLLESVEGEERFARYSFLGHGPSEILTLKDNEVSYLSGDQLNRSRGNGIDQLRELLSKYEPVELSGLPPLTGGAIGYISYDAVRYFVNLNGSDKLKTQNNSPPDLQFAFYRTIMAFDHFKHQAVLISNVFLEPDEVASGDESLLRDKYDSAVERISSLEELLSLSIEHSVELMEKGEYNETFQKKDFLSSVDIAKDHIVKGDAFQIVLSKRDELENHPEPFEIYRALRTINPSPYLFYLKMDDQIVTGSSPEMLVKVQNRKVHVRPIAGTRPRGSSDAEDKALEDELRKDEKERAEHAMLVDLGRNDVGKVSKYGTVKVSELMAVEKYSHVMHLVSRVSGELADDKDALDALVAAFPAGTVTGAPKKRAMEIIDELEPVKRGIYAGAVGYLDYKGNIDTCIAIRTISFRDGKAYIQAGAGIVYDSIPEKEYEECGNKAEVLKEAISMAAGGL
ncbi:MAG: anthranilate synthase component I [Candidatus Marinimicrobia bacterium]|nr:anthranilate synthase component I [Candidatus Neomarinimicrobiota bacterium]